MKFDICTPIIQQCEGYRPKSGKIRFYIEFRIRNSGISDMKSQIEYEISANKAYFSVLKKSEEKSTIKENEYYDFTHLSSRRRLDGESSYSIVKSSITG